MGIGSKAAQVDLLGLGASVDLLNATRVSMQASIAGTAASLVYAQDDLTALTTVVAGKAAQTSLDALSTNFNAVATSLNGQMSTVNSLLGTRASTTALTGGLALKQDTIGASLGIGVLHILGDTDVGSRKHDAGIAFSTIAGQVYGLLEPAGATLSRLVVQDEIVLPDNSIQIAKVSGLSTALSEIATPADGSLAMQQTAGLVDALLTKATTASLTAGLNTRQTTITGASSVTVGTLTAANASTTEDFTCGGYATLIGGASVSGTLATQDVATNELTVNGEFDVISTGGIAKMGNLTNYLRINSGHHIDALIRSTNAGRSLYIQYYANSDVRIGNTATRLGVCCNPAHPLDVVGIGRFSGGVQALSYTSTSDARIKAEVLPASLEECTRLVQTVRPQCYRRTDLDSSRRLGYIANHWDAELSSEHRNIMGPVTGEESLLSLDYSRIVPVLHGALLSALARIDALESLLT